MPKTGYDEFAEAYAADNEPSEVIPEHIKDVTRFISFIFFVLEAC